MTDKPFPDLQRELKASNMGSINYSNRAPLALNGSSCETEHEIRPSRIGWMIWPALVLGFVVVAAVASI